MRPIQHGLIRRLALARDHRLGYSVAELDEVDRELFAEEFEAVLLALVEHQHGRCRRRFAQRLAKGRCERGRVVSQHDDVELPGRAERPAELAFVERLNVPPLSAARFEERHDVVRRCERRLTLVAHDRHSHGREFHRCARSTHRKRGHARFYRLPPVATRSTRRVAYTSGDGRSDPAARCRGARRPAEARSAEREDRRRDAERAALAVEREARATPPRCRPPVPPWPPLPPLPPAPTSSRQRRSAS